MPFLAKKPERPIDYAFVVRHKFENTFLSSKLDGKPHPAIMGFATRNQALTISKNTRTPTVIEKREVSHMVRMCQGGYLSFVLFHPTGECKVFDDKTATIDDMDVMRFMLETNYKYY